MSNRIMLINGRHAEQLRVAVVDGGVLQLYDVEGAEVPLKRGNVYRGVVTNVERSLNAAFVDFGDAKNGFLTRHDVIPQAYRRAAGGAQHPPIDQVLQKGQPIVVQVTRDAEGGKGATLTTNVSLAGRFLVYFPYDEQRGVSRKVEDEALRRKLREKAKDLDLEEGEGFIVRTNAADQTKADLKADLQALKRLWKAVVDDAAAGKSPKLLYDDQDLLFHSLRDNLDAKVEEVLIDDEQLLAKAQRYVQAVMPRAKVALRLHAERAPLFARFNLEAQIESIYRRTVGLPGGGAIVIDHAEALTAIDVNSGSSKAGKNQGDTAYATNLEAAAEVGRQLRLRDIGGLVVVDFIDMRSRSHRHEVEKVLREAMKQDRARHEVGRIGENGLVEINRQRIRSALQLRTRRVCPTCEGVGRIISPELLSLNLVRRIEARAAGGRLARAKVALHPKVADYVQNNRRRELADIEGAYRIVVEIVGDPGAELSTERYEWFDLPAWELPAVPAPRAVDEGEGAAPAEPGAPFEGEPSEAEPFEAEPVEAPAEALPAAAVRSREATPREATQEPREAEGGGKRSRRKRRRRGRRRDGGAAEPASREWAQTPAASIGSVVEIDGNRAPEAVAAPVDGAPPRSAEAGQPREADDGAGSSRRRRRRRRRSRGGGAAGPLEAGWVSQETSAGSAAADQDAAGRDEARVHAPAAPAAAPPAPEAPVPAPAPAATPAPEAAREAAPEPPAGGTPKKRATRKAAPKKAAAPKKKAAKAAPRKSAAGKAAAQGPPPESQG